MDNLLLLYEFLLELCGRYRENAQTVAYQEQSLDLCFPHVYPQGCPLSRGHAACNLGVAALCIFQRGLAIPESFDTQCYKHHFLRIEGQISVPHQKNCDSYSGKGQRHLFCEADLRAVAVCGGLLLVNSPSRCGSL